MRRTRMPARKTPIMQKGGRHAVTMPQVVAIALEQAAQRNWRCCGDLLSKRDRRLFAFCMLPDEQRFALQCVEGSSGCWEWIGFRRDGGAGYAKMVFRGTSEYAHRVAYLLFVGPIPDDMTIDHLCKNKGCVNPGHLECVTSGENTLRWARTISHCPGGHEYTPQNTYVTGNHRGCKECRHNAGSPHTARRESRAVSAGAQRQRLKLSDEDIAAMKTLRAEGKPLREVAATFGVTQKYASAITVGSRKRRGRYTGPTKSTLLLVKLRSSDRCEFAHCSTLAAHTHHRRPRRMGSTRRKETNLAANLLRLCSDHHDWVESHRTEALALGLLLHDGDLPAAVPVDTRYGRVLLTDTGDYAEASSEEVA